MGKGIQAFRIAARVAAIAVCALSAIGAARAEDPVNVGLPVPKVTIYPGDVIEADKLYDMLFVARTVTRGSIFEGRDPVIGKVASRTLLANKPIPLNAVREPYAVTQGKMAFLIYRADGLTITTSAMALQNGSVGDVVSARNVDSGLTVKGTVQADGTVRVD